jgi:hypothetical protein
MKPQPLMRGLVSSTIGTGAAAMRYKTKRRFITMEEKFETLGQLIDSLDNFAHALKMPLPPQMHVEVLSKSLPEKVKELKSVFVEITGENPWD